MSTALRALKRAGVVSLFAALGVLPTPQRVHAAPAPVFVPGPCPQGVHLPSNIDTSWVRCGTVTVPQDRANPRAKLTPIVLPVIVYETPSAHAKLPLVFLAGGPGEPAVEIVTNIFLETPVGQLLMRERPIIAFNQRGCGADSDGTSPSLGFLTYQRGVSRQESIDALSESAQQIERGLRQRGIRADNFTTLNGADDLADVLTALGYSRAALFATSYGTKVALQFMRLHPAMVEAAVLDGVAPPQSTEVFDPEHLNRELRTVAVRIIEDCVKSLSCHSEYPSIGTLTNAAASIDSAPIRVVMSLPPSHSWYTVDVNRRDLLTAVGAYAGTDLTRAVPLLLDDVIRGDTLRRERSPDLVLYTVYHKALAQSAGPDYPVVYHIVLCGDIPSGVLQAGGRAVCDALGVPFGGPDAVNAVKSDVPILMLSSSYDALTTPDMADDAARTLSHSYHVVFPGVGHLAYARPLSAACVALLVQEFLNEPLQAPPDSCSTALSPSFLPRSTSGP